MWTWVAQAAKTGVDQEKLEFEQTISDSSTEKDDFPKWKVGHEELLP